MLSKQNLTLAMVACLQLASATPSPGTELGVHLDTYSAPETPIDAAGAYLIIKDLGGSVVRRNIYWDSLQTRSGARVAAFDARSVAFDAKNYNAYLAARGYGEAGENLRQTFTDLAAARKLGLTELFNLNVIPAWAKRYPEAQYPDPKAHALADNAAVGAFLFDFVVYVSRQPEGREVLRHVAGFELFNEVDGWAQKYNPGYGPNQAHQLPLSEYFEILLHAIAMTGQAFDAIGWKTADARPPVIGPNTTADYQPALWEAYLRELPTGADAVIGLHPYGITLRPWIDPSRIDAGAQSVEVPGAWEKVRDNLSYGRILQPTDDLAWWRALVARNERNRAKWRLYLYGPRGVPAEEHFNRNAELGVERTLAQFHLAGLPVPKVFFSEFGASLFRGTAAEDGLQQTQFADPYRYGFHDAGKALPEGVARNLAMESLAQSLGLIEAWDFVAAATVYDLFDGGKDGYLEEYGLARSELRNGKAALHPQGRLFSAYLQGRAVREMALSDPDGTMGVDLFVDSVGGQGPFKPKGRNAAAHETVLLRDGDDQFNAGDGDDVVFGGAGRDKISGGDGFDKLYGGPGDDTLEGGAGADRIKGDAGDDVLRGGEGADTFVFSAYGRKGAGFGGRDVIADFDPAEDRIVLVGGYEAKLLLPEKGLLEQVPDGTLIHYARNGASVLLNGVKATAMTADLFDVLTPDPGAER
jgi:RTX calcium-binding nonapeptide repeat (4 copies)